MCVFVAAADRAGPCVLSHSLKYFARRAVLAGAVMFKPDAAHRVRERQQEIVMIVMVRAEQLVSLLHQIAMRLKLLRADLQFVRLIGDDIQMHRNSSRRGPDRTAQNIFLQKSANRPACSTAPALNAVASPLSDAVSSAVPNFQPAGNVTLGFTVMPREK